MRRGPGRALLLATLGALYFAQGLPAGLLGKALPALARDAGLAPQWIGLLALPALPWALKFVWAPWVDRWGSQSRGHRQRWMLVCLAGVALLLLLAGMADRSWLFGSGIGFLLLLLLVLNLFSATQDIATDGLATRLLTRDLRGLGNSIQVSGYKIGMLLGSSVLLLMTDVAGWRSTLWLMAVLLLAIMLLVRHFPEPDEPVRQRQSISFRWWWRQLHGFWSRPSMGTWLLVLLAYKVGDGFGSTMIKPCLVDQGWSLAAIGRLDLIASLVGLLGAGMAGICLLRLPHRPALVIFGSLQALAFVGWQAVASGQHPAWIWPVALFEQWADGLSTVALFAVMMDYCRQGHEGSDYTLQACVQLFAVGLFTLASGFSVAWLGYSMHFLLAALLGALAVLLVCFWQPPAALSRSGH
ncbi:transmembrane transport protein [Alcanivorax hongdengensis A-11-3]|uniref:Transmembrane transport protein n=1 Tax=Alcanivorax hongdengensis A-11-3 TaxID=1177179 RepID=L0WFS5_9GAMM|nr:MFS transporter [Alcanivorax hongdengensis]EKF74992.1 transmembrane transport protein [Alcanivorax hongdengensis A-11-3]